jgi:adenylosuccinate synthase
VRLNGLDSLAITKLDVLTGLERLKICVGYEFDGERVTTRPASQRKLARCTPVYMEIPGWQEDISQARRLDQLPPQTLAYLETIEEITGVSVSIISVGAGREDTILVQDPF